ncbi:unnamed protein product [Cylicocyclus nassatus]|uniref:Uncharacterized protein n=1 Tax=Cylicocyclus nassatus TaxID=53992 RepID=A0AA36H835_CYLNA|nr:unnamed protein product [Cylicocyclus nassatus]
MQLLTIFGFIFSFVISKVGSTQSVAVTGRLVCNEKPAADVKVKLYEKELILDVKMDEGRTNESGEFHLSGSKKEVSTIDPQVNVYHKCDYNGICYRKFGIAVPADFVTEGPTPQKTFDIGIVNLANKFTGESIDCIN